MTRFRIITVSLILVFAVPPVAWAAAEHTPATNAHNGGGSSDALVPLPFDPDLAICTLIVFVVLLLVLAKFAWGPIMEALEHREQGIADHISAAEAKNEEAAQLLVDYEKRLSNAANEVRELLEEARRDAEHTKGQIVAEAKAAASAEHERAMRDVGNAKDAALQAIAEVGADMAVTLAGKIVKKELKAEDHAELVREAVVRFPTAAPSDN